MARSPSAPVHLGWRNRLQSEPGTEEPPAGGPIGGGRNACCARTGTWKPLL